MHPAEDGEEEAEEALVLAVSLVPSPRMLVLRACVRGPVLTAAAFVLRCLPFARWLQVLGKVLEDHGDDEYREFAETITNMLDT